MELRLIDLIIRWIRLSHRRFFHFLVQLECQIQFKLLLFLYQLKFLFLWALFHLFLLAFHHLFHVFFNDFHLYSYFPFFFSFPPLFLFPFFLYVPQSEAFIVQVISPHLFFSSIFPGFLFPVLVFELIAFLLFFFSFLPCAWSFVPPLLFFSLHILSFVIRSIHLQMICLHQALVVFSFIFDLFDLQMAIFLHVVLLFQVFTQFLLLWGLYLQAFFILYSIWIVYQDVVQVSGFFDPSFSYFHCFYCVLEILQTLQYLILPQQYLLVVLFEDVTYFIFENPCHLNSFFQLDPSYLWEKSQLH